MKHHLVHYNSWNDRKLGPNSLFVLFGRSGKECRLSSPQLLLLLVMLLLRASSQKPTSKASADLSSLQLVMVVYFSETSGAQFWNLVGRLTA